MIYLFRVISDEDQNFYRDVVIDGSDTFLDFHLALQQELGYDPSQLASFFITGENWEKQQEITLIDMGLDQEISAVPMEHAALEAHINSDSQRMIYVFDFFSDRALFIELLERSDLKSPRETPFIGSGRGEAPPQIALDLLMDDAATGEDEFYTGEEEEDPGLDDLDPDSLDNGFPEDY